MPTITHSVWQRKRFQTRTSLIQSARIQKKKFEWPMTRRSKTLRRIESDNRWSLIFASPYANIISSSSHVFQKDCRQALKLSRLTWILKHFFCVWICATTIPINSVSWRTSWKIFWGTTSCNRSLRHRGSVNRFRFRRAARPDLVLRGPSSGEEFHAQVQLTNADIPVGTA